MREGGREGEREGWREGGREGEREGGRERGREGGREGGREEREKEKERRQTGCRKRGMGRNTPENYCGLPEKTIRQICHDVSKSTIALSLEATVYCVIGVHWGILEYAPVYHSILERYTPVYSCVLEFTFSTVNVVMPCFLAAMSVLA